MPSEFNHPEHRSPSALHSALGFLSLTPQGLYCDAGGFHIDPWAPTPRAVITHAHGDHLAVGCGSYLTSSNGADLVRLRVGSNAQLEPLRYGETRNLGGVELSLHPAGHILGSAQVRLQHRGEVVVISGDFKRQEDPTCSMMTPLACDVFVTESTFGLPIYRWPEPEGVIHEINQWWRTNQEQQRPSVLFAYAMGKAQRILASIDASIGPIWTHGAVEKFCAAYRQAGKPTPATQVVVEAPARMDWSNALIVAPPSAQNSAWMRRFGRAATGMASGWMRVRGMRRRRSLDRGFVLSDHADWNALLDTIHETGAERILTTHGHAASLARHLTEKGLHALPLPTRFQGETLADDADSMEGPDEP